MNGQSNMRAPNKCFLTLVPWQSQNLKPGRSSLTDIREHLLKGTWKGMIPAKPAVQTNIIGVRLNSITLKTCFLPTEKKITQTQKELHGFANKLTEGSRQSVTCNGRCCGAYWSLELRSPVCSGNWGPWMPVQHLTPLGTATFICQVLRK